GLELGRDVDRSVYAGSSDHWPLHLAGIPAVTIFGADPRAMDGPLDTVDLVDVDTMRRVARVVYRMVRDLASR
ncbi:MAG: M28 family peptidase, partial [Planctomycetota bacterium]